MGQKFIPIMPAVLGHQGFTDYAQSNASIICMSLTAIMVMNLIRIKLCEHHPHTSGLHKSKYCVMPDPFPAERFGKGRATPDYSLLQMSLAPRLSRTIINILLSGFVRYVVLFQLQGGMVSHMQILATSSSTVHNTKYLDPYH